MRLPSRSCTIHVDHHIHCSYFKNYSDSSVEYILLPWQCLVKHTKSMFSCGWTILIVYRVSIMVWLYLYRHSWRDYYIQAWWAVLVKQTVPLWRVINIPPMSAKDLMRSWSGFRESSQKCWSRKMFIKQQQEIFLHMISVTCHTLILQSLMTWCGWRGEFCQHFLRTDVWYRK